MTLKFRSLRQRDVALLVLAATVLGAALWYFYLYKPVQTRIGALESEIAQIDLQIQRGEAAQANLPILREAVEELKADGRAFLEQLPRENNIAALIEELKMGAENASVTLDAISRGSGGEEVQDVRPISISIATQGNYAQTMTFLETLETLRRFTKIGQVGLSLQDEGSDDPTLSATYAFTVYVFTGEDPGEL